MGESTFWLVVVAGALVLLLALGFVYRLIMRTSIAAEPDDDEPVAILSGLAEIEAELYRSKLDAAGIMAFVRAGGWFAPTLWYRPVSGWQVIARFGDRFAAEECLGMRLATSDDAGAADTADTADGADGD